MDSIETDSQHSGGTGRGCCGVWREGKDFNICHASKARTSLRADQIIAASVKFRLAVR